jgi:crotonobetainyl-CoA:carnitine CoA-transferase CaiB-like acyl-CoA transferase
MASPIARAALDEVWTLAGGDPDALSHVTLSGADPVLPSSFAVGALAQATIAAAGLAAAELQALKSGHRQRVHVDMRHAAAEFRSERTFAAAATTPPLWDTIAGLYRTGDGRHVRIHTNFEHHRNGMLALLGAGYDREDVQRALLQWRGETFEDAAAARGLVATLTRSAEQWRAHPQGVAVAAQPLLTIERIGDAPPEGLPMGDRPLSGVRVLDLTRIIAGPVGGRTLAAHGADVLLVTSPRLPSIPSLVVDTGRGKLSTHIDLETEDGRATLSRLVTQADIFIQGYRPGGLSERGFSPEALARARPGIVCVSLSAYGAIGPWATRRGFDSLTQNTNGINVAEAAAAGQERPKELPAQALDHGAGFLIAFASMMALRRRASVGGSWHVRVSLAQVGEWLKRMPRVSAGLSAPDPATGDVQDLLETTASGFGPLTAVRHAAILSETPAYWSRPSVPLGTHAPEWPARN